ncbi:MAG: serine--tRNA ligase [Candidatus Harrisonbacteria bacterium]|nr:serine--tRNA ligase [Candidatus Harrisonbacteria bacterium]MBI2406092.1 serine--tRNA ligase [Candidatus Harrisonbacteria bacterium]
MLDIALIRKSPDEVKARLATKHIPERTVDMLLAADSAWRALTQKTEELRARLNALSKEKKIEEAKAVKAELKEAEKELPALELARNELLSKLPNLPDPAWPVGKDESENKVLREVGKKPEFDFRPLDYLAIAEPLGLIDMARAAKVAGSRFGYLFGEAALLEFALVQFAMQKLVRNGFRPVVPPVMIKPEVFKGMGRLTGGQEEERYHLPKDDLYLVGSAEHTIGPMHMDEVLLEKNLPLRYVGFSTCFRREAGSYGKDTKGILRVHQFDKVEMFSYAHPEHSNEEHEFLLAMQEELMQALGLHYRVVQICTGDMGFTDARQYDIETWLPGEGKYRETHSCSNTTDFQSRGVNIKYAAEKGKALVHMLNATGFAIGRTIIAIMEQYQTKDGGFLVPEVLRPYMMGPEKIEPRA